MYNPTASLMKTQTCINRSFLNASNEYVCIMDIFKAGPQYRTTRPNGRSDWLILLTHQGSGILRQGKTFQELPPGSLAIYEAGTPQDYGCKEAAAPWIFSFAHILPRTGWSDWISKWPHPLPGTAVLQLEDLRVRSRVEKEMTQARHLFHFSTRSRIAFVENALEKMLLWAHESSSDIGPELDPRLRRATEQIGNQLKRHWTAAALAAEAGLSPSRLNTLFRKQLGQSPVAYAERVRLEHAATLIQDMGLSVKEAADAVGYDDPYHFSRRFKLRLGRPPSHLNTGS